MDFIDWLAEQSQPALSPQLGGTGSSERNFEIATTHLKYLTTAESLRLSSFPFDRSPPRAVRSSMSSFGARRALAPTRVFVNVYDLSPYNESMRPLGIGVYHSGLEVQGVEYTFASGAGIISHAPRQAEGAAFRESVCIGEVSASAREVEAVALAERGDQALGLRR